MYAVPYLETIQAMLLGIPDAHRRSAVFSMSLAQWAKLGGPNPDADKIDAACGQVLPAFDTATRKHLANMQDNIEAHIRWARQKQGTPHLSRHATGRDIERSALVLKSLPAGLQEQAMGKVTTRRGAAKAPPPTQRTEPLNFTDKKVSVEYQLLRRHSDELLVISRQTAVRNGHGLPLALIVFSRIYTDWHLPLMEIDAGRAFRDILFQYLSWFRSVKHYKYLGKKRVVQLEMQTKFVPWDVDWAERMWGKHQWPGRDLSGAVGEQDSVLAQQTRLRQYEKSIIQIAKQVLRMPAAQISPLTVVPEGARAEGLPPSHYINDRVSAALTGLVRVRISFPLRFRFN